MEKREVLTLIGRNHKFDDVELLCVVGEITGIGYAIANTKNRAISEICEGHLYRSEFTPNEYDKFMNIVEELYPGLCKFNYQERESY